MQEEEEKEQAELEEREEKYATIPEWKVILRYY